MSGKGNGPRRIVYCNCTYSKVVPADVKREVLARLSASNVAFDAIPDLCEMSARKDPALERISASGPVTIAACYPRAVRWLFHAGGFQLPEDDVTILNMREQPADEVVSQLIPVESLSGQEN